MSLDVANLGNEVVELLLGGIVLLGHLLVLGLPLVAGGLQGLHLALVVAGLDIGLAEPTDSMSVRVLHRMLDMQTYLSLVSLKFLSASSASSSRSCSLLCKLSFWVPC